MKELNYLSALMLKLDNEKMIYEETNAVLDKKQKDVFKKYRIGFKIAMFLYKTRDKDPQEFRKEYDEFVAKKASNGKVYGDYFSVDFDSVNEKGYTYSLKTSGNIEYIHPEKAECKIYQMYSALKSNGEKTITTIVQYFEEFLSSFLYIIISQKPEAFLFKKQIEYSQLVEKNIETIKEEILRQEVRSLMFDAVDTLEKLDNMYNYNLSGNDLFEKYKEIDMHRNIIVHNRGVVNSDYNHGVSKKYQKEIDAVIECEPALIEEDILTIEKLAFLLSYLQGETESDADMLENVAFDALTNEKWDFSRFAYSLLKKCKNISNDLRATYVANYLLACKKIDGLEKTKKEIEKFDVSGMERIYIMAKNLLLEKNRDVVSDLEVVFNDSISAQNLECWPIFSDFRKTDEYATFVKNHPAEFSAYENAFDNVDDSISIDNQTHDK